MSARLKPALLFQRDEIVAPPAPRSCEDHSFEFPTAIYGMMAALLFGFLAIMALGFSDPMMVVPMAVNFAFLTAFFAIPVIFVKGSPDDVGPRARRWSEFMRNGVQTATGHTSGREAVVLTLLLPVLVFFWGIAVTAIAAFV